MSLTPTVAPRQGFLRNLGAPRDPATWALLLLAAAVPVAGALHGPFFAWDDRAQIEQGPFVLGKRAWYALFTQPRYSHYAPLHEALIWAQWKVFGPHPLGYRLVSLALHMFAAAGCWTMLTALTGRPKLAWSLALLWAAHPVQAECTAWISEQKSLLGGAFTFWALAYYADESHSRTRRVAGTLALLTLGCLGKATALCVAPLAVLYEIFLARGAPPAAGARSPRAPGLLHRLLATLPLVVVAGVFALVAWAVGQEQKPLAAWGLGDMLLSLPSTLALYLRVAFYPPAASFFHEFEGLPGFTLAGFVAPVAWVVGLVVLGGWLTPKPARRLYLFAWTAWLLALGPMLNFSTWTLPGYDRFQYPALPFILLAAALALEPVCRTRGCARLVAAILVLGVAVLGVRRGALFSNELALMQDAAQRAPGNAWSHIGVLNTLHAEWRDAELSGHADAPRQEALALRMRDGLERARRCANFPDFLGLPALHVLRTARALQFSGRRDEARALLLEIVNEPRWACYAREQAQAYHLLVRQVLLHAGRAALPPADSIAAVQEALALLARAREFREDADENAWLESQAHVIWAKRAEEEKEKAKR